MNTPLLLETLARQALDGDREALDTLVRALQDDIYRLALRMLWNREDAEDATQEILVRIVTRLSQFGFRSRLKTWAYRLSVNYILDLKKSPIERLELTFQRFADNLTEGIEPASANETERSVLIDEVKVGCSLAMLQCLDRSHRIAFVLGDIMELSGPEASEILEIDRRCFESDCSSHARPFTASFGLTAGWYPTMRPADAIGGWRLRRSPRSRRRSR